MTSIQEKAYFITGIADYVENEWPDYPVGIKPLLPPLATLYNGPESKKPKFSIVEMVLYNMAAMLAGFAAGYDVRLSNVSAIHPRLHPDRYVLVLHWTSCLMLTYLHFFINLHFYFYIRDFLPFH